MCFFVFFWKECTHHRATNCKWWSRLCSCGSSWVLSRRRQVQVIVRPTVVQAVHQGTHDKTSIFIVWQLLSFFFIRHPHWRENGSVIFSSISSWLESHRNHNHILLSHPRLPQPGGPGPQMYPISPRNILAQLYPRALGCFFVVSYGSRGYGGGILTHPHTGHEGDGHVSLTRTFLALWRVTHMYTNLYFSCNLTYSGWMQHTVRRSAYVWS
jgi:hypothetical protein